TGNRRRAFVRFEDFAPADPFVILFAGLDLAGIRRGQGIVEFYLRADEIEDRHGPRSFPKMAAAIFLSGAAGEHEMAALFGVLPPALDELFVNQLAGRHDEERIRTEIF